MIRVKSRRVGTIVHPGLTDCAGQLRRDKKNRPMLRATFFGLSLPFALLSALSARAQTTNTPDAVSQLQEQQRQDYEQAKASAAALSSQPAVNDASALYRNTSLPYSQRADDLIRHMTVAQKIEMMNCVSKAMPDLGIPAFSQWRECLHGILPQILDNTPIEKNDPGARGAFRATVYPEPITTAASWDAPLMHQIGHEISDEARGALHGAGSSFFGPNINIFRDPRWGRGQETPGEDPYLNGRYAVAFITGLQGDDPIHAESLGCAKHYAAHSGPESERYYFNVDVSQHDLYDTYFPAFEAAVREAKVGQVMSSYNAVNGVPASLSPFLLNDVLRNQWGFDGDVITDAEALDQASTDFNYDTPLEATALAVNAGLDTDIGGWFRYLPEALKQGLITEKQIDRAVKYRLMLMYRLGQMDDPSLDPYSKIPASVVDSPQHRDTARQAAREGIVLLKNDNQTLPLAKGLKKIALIGPMADQELLGNYNGVPSKAVTIAQGLAAANGGSISIDKVGATSVYSPAYPGHLQPLPLEWLNPAGAPAALNATQGIWARYFHSRTSEIGRQADGRVETTSKFQLLAGDAPKDIHPRNFTAVWETIITPPADVLLIVNATSGSKVKLQLNNKTVIETPGWSGDQIGNDGGVLLKGGTPTHVVFTTTADSFQLLTAPPMQLDFSRALASVASSDAVVLACGIPHSYEDESVDRPTTRLPWDQMQLIEQVMNAAGSKPVILVVTSGSSIAMPWAADHVPAIIWCGKGGEEAGSALADMLFGDYNPAGRLPVTFYAGDDQLPPEEDYNMETAPGRTYRYFTGKPQWEFGYGLSYTTFAYDGLTVTPANPTTADNVTVTVHVKNTGQVAGDEVSELYISHPPSSIPAPLRSLSGFARVHLNPQEEKTVTFTVTSQQLALVDADGKSWTAPGQVSLHIGGNQHEGVDQTIALTGDRVTPAYRIGSGQR
jgi:beta-glucosidase